jgi:hypothetical protein
VAVLDWDIFVANNW